MQHKKRKRRYNYSSVGNTVRQHTLIGTEKARYIRQKYLAENGKDNTENKSYIYKKRKISVSFIFVAFSESLGYDSAAAGTYHKTECAEYHEKRHYKIDCRKRRFAHKIGYEKPVDNTVYRYKNHHSYRWSDQF